MATINRREIAEKLLPGACFIGDNGKYARVMSRSITPSGVRIETTWVPTVFVGKHGNGYAIRKSSSELSALADGVVSFVTIDEFEKRERVARVSLRLPRPNRPPRACGTWKRVSRSWSGCWQNATSCTR
jgi:hypothetical protein